MNHAFVRMSVLALAIVTIGSTASFAAGDLGAEREDTMKGLNKELKALTAMVKSGKFDAEKSKASARSSALSRRPLRSFRPTRRI